MSKFNFKKNLAYHLQNSKFHTCSFNAAALKAEGQSERGLVYKIVFFKPGKGNSGSIKFFGTKEVQIHHAGKKIHCSYIATPTEDTARALVASIPR